MKEKFKDMEDRMRTSDINLIGGLEVEDRENGRYIISVAESFSEPMERPKPTDLGNTAHPWKDKWTRNLCFRHVIGKRQRHWENLKKQPERKERSPAKD